MPEETWYEVHAIKDGEIVVFQANSRDDNCFYWEHSLGEKILNESTARFIIDRIKHNWLKEYGIYDYDPLKVTDMYVVKCTATMEVVK